jgi:hypothetical protein
MYGYVLRYVEWETFVPPMTSAEGSACAEVAKAQLSAITAKKPLIKLPERDFVTDLICIPQNDRQRSQNSEES